MPHLFYHVWCANHWREIVREQLDVIRAAEFPDGTELHIGAIGTPEDLAELSRIAGQSAVEIVHHGEDPELFEFPTLEMLRNYSRHHNGAVCYFHTKGVSYPRNPLHDWWRETMNDGILRGWRKCVDALQSGFDVAGCRFTHRVHPLPYFAGNFWWATTDHIRKLPPFERENRYEAERWIVNGEPKEFHIPVAEPL